MSFLNAAYLWLMKSRLKEIDAFSWKAVDIQHHLLAYLLHKGSQTEYGKKYNFSTIRSAQDFRERVPVVSYEGLHPYIERMMKGERNILWPGKIRWFSKSSGTTNAKSKFIPVSKEALWNCHYKGGKDLFAMHIRQYPSSGVFYGKNVSMGGSLHAWPENPHIVCGDVSAIITRHLPLWAESRRTPRQKVALMADWDSKLRKMVEITRRQDVRSLLGVPSWMLIFLQQMLESTGKKDIREIWPHLELFVHGGVSLIPYREQFTQMLGRDFCFMETYNASEGFFGIQDDSSLREMLLMLDYGVYYEFLPLEEIGKEHPMAVDIENVEIGRNYALVISTNAGLWRYMIGDTIVFTSLRPYRFKISGRTRQFINTFGEELMVDNADTALKYACERTGAQIREYTAAPVFLDASNQARHQWLIEFQQKPGSILEFQQALDNRLKELNSDYEAKRHNDMLLKEPEIVELYNGCFLDWMKQKGKLGGQHKVPRLSNNRDYADEILSLQHGVNPTGEE